mmetsp:Transcript_4908/g.4682  ORF Transcript_4908/g.4682 Transcript_4908/m.4682 type:complete len:90 (+) Transcript_4908:768-1037(+)
MSNLMSQGGTQNIANEEVLKKKKDVLHLNLIKTSIMYDINLEHFGWNRNPEESVSEYVKRVWNDDYLQTFDNNAFGDMNFNKCMEVNDQ